MIKRILFFTLQVYAITLSGQINLQDSSVQVITYWDLGERYNYTVKEQTLKYSGTDTTENETFTYDVEVTVMDSTADSYTVRWFYKNFSSSSEDPTWQAMMSIFEDVPVDVSIDEVGGILGVKNWEEVAKYISDGANKILNEYSDLEGFDDMLMNYIKTYTSKEGIEATAIKDVHQYHNFHGGAYTLNEELKGVVKSQNFFNPDKPFDTSISMTLEDIDVENNDYLIRSIEEVDPTQLTDATYQYLSEMTNSLGEIMPPRDEFEDLVNVVETVSRIHNTGWVISSVQWKEVYTDGQTKLEIREILLK